MTDDEVETKFRRLAKGVVSDATTETILQTAWKLDELDDLLPLVSCEVLPR
jgi:hypothetical protein